MTKIDVINNQDFIILINEMKNIQIQIWCQDPFVFFWMYKRQNIMISYRTLACKET